MNSRKRQAPEELLPLRHSKQARRSRALYNGENTSPSQQEGILARWIQLTSELFTLTFETLGHILPDLSKASSPSIPPPPSSVAGSFPPPPRSVGAPPRAAPPRPVSKLSSAVKARPSPSLSAADSSSPAVKAEPSAFVLSPPTPPSGTPSAPAPAPCGDSSTDYRVLYPEIHAALRSSERRKCGAENRKRIPRREHIFAKIHKAQVMVEKQKQREQMMKELYTMRRAAGYGSNFHTFQDYMNYRAHLELLERREALPPSPSLADLRSKSPAQRKERRYSTSDYVETDLLTRSLEKARETLNSPRPPKPFIPSFDQLRISARNKDEAIERTLRPKRPPLPASLPPEDEAQVADFLANPKFLARLKREKVAAPDLERLTPGLWLNDEIINFYGALMMSRWETEKENRANQPQGNPTGRAGSRLLNIHYFNSFFWPKLLKEGYTTSLARWTNKVDIFAKDAVILAVNHGNSHWTAAAINFRRKRIESYDSMGFVRDTVYKVLRDYLDGEHRDKKKKPFDFTGWENYTLEATPQQENGYDCGVFTCQFMEYLSRGEQEFNFTQEDMPYLRSRMIWEIGNVRLRDD